MRSLALFLTIVTGFTGLVYEITWQKGLAILLGSHSEATAAVLAIFLGGLSLGYALFGRVSTRVTRRAGAEGVGRRLLLVYGAVEVGIGLWALAWPHLFHAARLGSSALPLHSEALTFAYDLLLTALLIGPPTVLMGGTIPLLTQALARDLGDATRFHAFVYGTNTLGAFSGAIAGGFFLIPWLGIPGVLTAMGSINLAAGGCFAGLSRLAPRDGSRVAPSEANAGSASFPLFAAVAALLGFAMMALQTVLIRVGGLALGASHFTFSITVATFVLCIAVGSLAVSPWKRIPGWAVTACPIALGLLLLLLFPVLPYAPYAAHVVRSLFQSIDQAFYPYFLAASLGILVAFLVPLALSGASLPLLFHTLRDDVAELGGLAGRLYGWNTVGSLLGALLGGYVLLFWLDLHHVYLIAVAAVLVAGGLLWMRSTSGRRRVAVAIPAALSLGALVLLPPWDPRQMSAGFFRERTAGEATWRGPEALLRRRAPFEVLFHDDDPTTTVTVIEFETDSGTTRAIKTNGKADGSLAGDYRTMALVGLLPCTMMARCRTAFVIGLGTGVTAGELAALGSMERVRVSEISPAVIDAAPLFDGGNLGASKSPKIEVVRGDAYRALLHDDERWDVIVSEPSNPWVAGVEMLYSREFLEAARARLAPGGIYAQWMHAYELDDETLELVLRTYASVFEHVSVWFAQSHDLILLGFQDETSIPDLERIAERFERSDLRAGLDRSGITTLEELLAHELIPGGVVTAEAMPGEVHTLLQPRLSHQAARAFFAGGVGILPYLPVGGGADVPLLRQLSERRGESEEIRARIVEEICETRPRECAVRLARWLHDEPGSQRLEQVLEEQRSSAGWAEHLEESRLELLASLFAAGPGRVGLEGTNRVITHFFDYYHHAEPFRRGALERTWRSCLEPGCTELIGDARRRLATSNRSALGYSRQP